MPINSFADYPLSWRPAREALKPGPVYLALAAALADDIAGGALPPGTKLPPQRELADYLDLDFTTVTRAYGVCRERGLVYGVTGRGTFVAAPDSESASDSRSIDCAVVQGFPEVGADAIVAAAKAVLARDAAAQLFSYRNRDGAVRPRAAGLAWLARNGVRATPEQTAVFPGAQGALSAVLLSLPRVGDALATDEFTYANLIRLAHLAHVRLAPVPSDADGMLPDALSDAAKDRRVRGVFLMPNVANPTTCTLTERRKNELAEVIRRRDLTLIEDDSRLLPPTHGERPLCARIPERTIYIAGSTRALAPGLRATWMAFPADNAARILDALHQLTIKAGALDAEILAELVFSDNAERVLSAKAKKARTANAIFNRMFPNAPAAAPTAFFRQIPLPGTAGQGPDIERRCRAAGVRVCHSDRFSVRIGNPHSFLRVSVSSAPDLSTLRRALATIRDTAAPATASTGRVTKGNASPSRRT